ncbi:unnamed protein product [Peronospora farinosa]|uniref:Uncharacterized protein n=1 Tax=Peronospora farinosa TaxID=134698 RepID=A0AAV0U7L4_9STRA|nr:unnamed protein product [Peronospora farinosa]
MSKLNSILLSQAVDDIVGTFKLPTVKSSQQEDLCLITPFTVKWLKKECHEYMTVDGRSKDYQQEEKGDQEVFQEVRHFSGLRHADHADLTLVRSWLYRADKFPTRATSKDLLTEKADQVRSTVKFQINKVMCLNVAIDHVAL